MRSIRRISQDSYPVQLFEAKDHLRLDGDDNDRYVQSLIATASEWIQAKCGRALTVGVYELTLDRLPAGPVTLPVPPAYRPDPQITVTVEATGGGLPLTPAAYLIDDDLSPRAAPTAGEWPAGGRAKIRWRAGYGSAADVPPQIKHAILIAITGFFDDRSGNSLTKGTPQATAIDALLASCGTGFLAGGAEAIDWGLDGTNVWPTLPARSLNGPKP